MGAAPRNLGEAEVQTQLVSAIAATVIFAGRFVDRDLYVVVHQLDGKALAHGANEKLVGTNMIDVEGVPYGVAQVDRIYNSMLD